MTATKEIATKKNPLRGIKGKSIQHHLTVLGAERFLPDVYINSRTKKHSYETIYERHERHIILWAAVKAFRKRAKKAKSERELRKLIEAYQAIKKILRYH